MYVLLSLSPHACHSHEKHTHSLFSCITNAAVDQFILHRLPTPRRRLKDMLVRHSYITNIVTLWSFIQHHMHHTLIKENHPLGKSHWQITTGRYYVPSYHSSTDNKVKGISLIICFEVIIDSDTSLVQRLTTDRQITTKSHYRKNLANPQKI